jgi:hypothetical protein
MLGAGGFVGSVKVLGLGLLAVLPLGETQVTLAAALSENALVLLQAATDRTGRDGQVAVVAIRRSLRLAVHYPPIGVASVALGPKQWRERGGMEIEHT